MNIISIGKKRLSHFQLEGGDGSGNIGHAGVPGQWGGSAPKGKGGGGEKNVSKIVATKVGVSNNDDVHKYMKKLSEKDDAVYTASIVFGELSATRHGSVDKASRWVDESSSKNPAIYGYWSGGKFNKWSDAIQRKHKDKLQKAAYSADR